METGETEPDEIDSFLHYWKLCTWIWANTVTDAETKYSWKLVKRKSDEINSFLHDWCVCIYEDGSTYDSQNTTIACSLQKKYKVSMLLRIITKPIVRNKGDPSAPYCSEITEAKDAT